MTQPCIDISIACEKWTAELQEIEPFLASVAGQTLLRTAFKDMKNTELSIVLADNAFVQNLNHIYRGKDKPTNVLSFPQNTPESFEKGEHAPILGDVILAFETVKSESISQNKKMKDHTAHLLVHGILHLLGFDHETADEAQRMETLEIKILDSLSIKNPYEVLDFVQ